MDESSDSPLSEPASLLSQPASPLSQPASPLSQPASLLLQPALSQPASPLSQPASSPAQLHPVPRLMISKRRREVDTTYHERIQLFSYTQNHPKITQKDLVKWFNTTFNKSINQSTVSRKLYIKYKGM